MKRIVPARSPSASMTKSAESVQIGLGSRDLRENLVASLRTDGGEERLDVLVRHELDQEVGVVEAGAADCDVHAADS